ncbi:MAG: magnesium transporter CorA family protein [Acidimicrobiia bacterium]
MQRLFHKKDPDSPLVEHAPGEIDALRSAPGYIWLDLLGEPAPEIRALAEPFELDRVSLEDAIDISLLPRIDEHDHYVFVVLEGLVVGSGERLTTSEIDIFIGEKFLITIHRDPFPAVEWLQAPTNAASTANLDSPARITAFIAQLGTRRYLPLIEALEERIDVLEDMAMASDPRTLTEVHALRRDVGLLRRSIAPQRDVFNELAESLHPVIDAQAARAFDRVFDHHLKIVDSLDAARGLLASVLETHRGAVADQTNEIVRILTVFSAVLLPMSVISGMWGMNFVEIPLADWRWGFAALVGFMLLLGIGLWLYFGRRRFIGGPKLRELPKSVGLGLLQIGVLPIKVVSTGVRQMGRIVYDAVDGENQRREEQGEP